MVKITDKRTEKIQPTKIDNDLLFSVSRIMQEACPEGFKVSVVINSDSKDIETETNEELREQEIPADTYFVHLSIDNESVAVPWENPVDITIDTKFPEKNSRIRVRGNDPTWVLGVSERLVSEFNKKKLGYRHLAKYENLRFTISILLAGLFAALLALGMARIPGLGTFYGFLVIITVFYAMMVLLRRFLDWVFPYFEIVNEEFKPRKFRKLALGILLGSGVSGIIVDLVLRYIGMG